VETIEAEGLVERSAALGPVVADLVRGALATHCDGMAVEVRQRGLLIGIDLPSGAAATELMLGLLAQRVIPSYSLNSHQVLRLTPPALLDQADLDWLAEGLDGATRHLAAFS